MIVITRVMAIPGHGKLDRYVVRKIQRHVGEFTRIEVKRAAVVNRVRPFRPGCQHQKIALAD